MCLRVSRNATARRRRAGALLVVVLLPRVPIHIHQISGLTCIISGQITDFVEGQTKKVFGAGDCYYMPAETPMSAVNLGAKPVVLVDIFVLPDGEKSMKVIESGVDYP